MESTTAIEAITPVDTRRFLASLEVSGKTARNSHVGLSPLWQCAKLEGLVPINIVREVKPPKADSRIIMPFTESEIRAMLKTAVKTSSIAPSATGRF